MGQWTVCRKEKMTKGEEKAYYLVVTFNFSGLKMMPVRVGKTSIDESAEVAILPASDPLHNLGLIFLIPVGPNC